MKLFKGIYLILMLLPVVFSATAQNFQGNDCILIKNAYESYCKHKYKKTVQILTEFTKEYPRHPLVEEAHYTIGLAWFEAGKYKKSNVVFNEIINKKDYPFPDSVYSISACISPTSKCPIIMIPDFSVNIQHESCLQLAETGFKTKNLPMAYTWIYTADKYYRYWYGCGTGDQEENMRLSIYYSRYYSALGKKDSAIQVMLPHALEPAAISLRYYPEIQTRLLTLLHQKFDFQVLKNSFDEAINQMKVESHKTEDMHLTYHYYIEFMNVKIPVAPPYLFGKTDNISEVKAYVRTLDFYKALAPQYNTQPDN